MEVSIEQEFEIRAFAAKIHALDEAQSKALLVKMYAQMLLREEAYRAKLRKAWGIGATDRNGG